MSFLQHDNKLPNLEMLAFQQREKEEPVFEDLQKFIELEEDLESELLEFSDFESEKEIEELHTKENWDIRVASSRRKLPTIPSRRLGNKNVKNHILNNQKCTILHAAKVPKKVVNKKKSALEELTETQKISLKILNKIFHNLKACQTELTGRRYPQLHTDIDVYKYTKSVKRQLGELIISKFIERVNQLISYSSKSLVLHGVFSFYHQREFAFKVFLTPPTQSWMCEELSQESSNLYKMDRAGIPAPRVFGSSQNILIISFIGRKRVPAPTLKEAVLSEKEYKLAHSQIVDSMVKLYNNAKLIHCNLTEDNILWYQKQCFFISVSQAISVNEVEAYKFLYRDCVNITKFFDSRGVKNVKRAHKLFKEVSGCNYIKKSKLNKMLKQN